MTMKMKMKERMSETQYPSISILLGFLSYLNFLDLKYITLGRIPLFSPRSAAWLENQSLHKSPLSSILPFQALMLQLKATKKWGLHDRKLMLEVPIMNDTRSLQLHHPVSHQLILMFLERHSGRTCDAPRGHQDENVSVHMLNKGVVRVSDHSGIVVR